ncbi:MAG: DUF6440 family protein [Streptococcaceae bacterium]|jgi:hypothetical protein|nr:DUF6440 family protein [Streptococcaceae bacterium]
MSGVHVIGGSKEYKEKLKKLIDKNNARFVKIPAGDGSLYVDSKTGVEYFSTSVNFGGGITVLLDRDGKPLINEDFQSGDLMGL